MRLNTMNQPRTARTCSGPLLPLLLSLVCAVTTSSAAWAQEAPVDTWQKNAVDLSSWKGFGSGFFVTANGYFVTNHHVIDGASRVSVRARGHTYNATVVRTDATNDLALLKVEGEGFSALHVGDGSDARSGDRVFTVGYPAPTSLGQTAKFSSGDLAATKGYDDDPSYLQVSVPLQPGNSGSPLVSEAGAVIGVVTGKWDMKAALQATGVLPENVSYAVKSSLLLTLLESVPEVAGKLVPKPAAPADEQATSQPNPAAPDPWSDRMIDIRFPGGSIGDYLTTLREATAPESVNAVVADDVLRLKANPVTLQNVSVRTAVFLLASPALTPQPLTITPTDGGPQAPPVYVVTPREPTREGTPANPAETVEPATGMVLVR